MTTTGCLNQVIQGHCLTVLKRFPPSSVDCVLFSPPYFNLRRYGKEAEQVFGGKADCDHQWANEENRRGKLAVGGRRCVVCGAWMGELGLENTPFEFVDHLSEICSELKRVLKDTGSLWIVIADSFYGGGKAEVPKGWAGWEDILKPRMKLGVPYLLRFALNRRGLISRDDVVWSKNAMPSSQLSRFSNMYENVFHFVKNAGNPLLWRNVLTGEWAGKQPPQTYFHVETKAMRPDKPHENEMYSAEGGFKRKVWHQLWQPFDYFFELDPVRVQVVPPEFEQAMGKLSGMVAQELYKTKYKPGLKAHSRTLRMAVTRTQSRILASKLFPGDEDKQRRFVFFVHDHSAHPKGKNPGDVWSIPTKGTALAHLAPFPPKLCEIPILSTCPRFVCRNCGSPAGPYAAVKPPEKCPTCGSADVGLGVLLDPFAGSATALAAAKQLGRAYIGIEAIPEFVELSRKRLAEVASPLDSFL